jgi:hypothetical protein
MEGTNGEINSFIFKDILGADSPVGIRVSKDNLTNPLGVGLANDRQPVSEGAQLAADATDHIISDDFWF